MDSIEMSFYILCAFMKYFIGDLHVQRYNLFLLHELGFTNRKRGQNPLRTESYLKLKLVGLPKIFAVSGSPLISFSLWPILFIKSMTWGDQGPRVSTATALMAGSQSIPAGGVPYAITTIIASSLFLSSRESPGGSSVENVLWNVVEFVMPIQSVDAELGN